MFLHYNDYVVWRNGDETIIAKLRILGGVEKANGRNVFLPQNRFWDTSLVHDPTKRILVGTQFQCIGFNGSDPEESVLFRTSITTDRGLPVAYSKRFRNENDHVFVFEYLSLFPMFVQIDNFLYGKRTMFEIGWERKSHETLKGEYIFYLRVGKREELIK